MMNKKILIVIGSFKTGGAERMAITVGEELNKSGYTVHYALQKPIFEIPNVIDSDRIHLLNKSSNKNKYLFHLSSILNIFVLRLKLQPSFIIGFTYYSSFIACFSLSRNVVGRFDINPYSLAKKRGRIASFVAYWPFVKKIVVPSYGIGDALRKINGQLEKKILVIQNSIDPLQVEILAAKQLEKEILPKSYIVAMGRFTSQKNYQLLLSSYAESKLKDKLNLVIIGDGKLKAELISIVERLKLTRKVTFTGFMENPFPIIQNASFFVNTSNFESFCNVILESLTLGVPVIATDCHYGPSEMIRHGYNGMLFETKSRERLVDIFDDISSNHIQISELQVNAKKSVEKFYLSKVIGSWHQLLKDT
ncbi:MAG: glycosyltransferase involved in cell wall biosynthesis [Psychroserpens sp.]|jgi:glycosyltransferase involved in cell wall biosynthesis